MSYTDIRVRDIRGNAEHWLTEKMRLRLVERHQAKKEPPPEGSRLSLFIFRLLRCDCGDGLQAHGNDLGADHFSGDDQFNAAVLLTAFGSIV
jgi:hypothetical protein